jgi:hypothetical protein
MKKTLSPLLALAMTATIALTGVLVAGQQEQKDDTDVRIQAGDVDIQADVDRQRQRDALRETEFRQAKPLLHRASAVIGMDVQNRSEENLGNIHDLVIDDQGKVHYAAVEFGGFLDIGDKLFAVPWQALQVKQVGDREDDNWVAVIDVTKEKLEKAKGFNKDNWPDMADEQWRKLNDETFRTAERDVETTPRR